MFQLKIQVNHFENLDFWITDIENLSCSLGNPILFKKNLIFTWKTKISDRLTNHFLIISRYALKNLDFRFKSFLSKNRQTCIFQRKTWIFKLKNQAFWLLFKKLYFWMKNTFSKGLETQSLINLDCRRKSWISINSAMYRREVLYMKSGRKWHEHRA